MRVLQKSSVAPIKWLIWSLVLVAATTVWAQDNEIVVGYAQLDESGSVADFNNQLGLSDGVFLDSLSLELHAQLKSFDRFKVDLEGFGAEPYQKARVRIKRDDWWFKLDYRQRDMHFESPGYEWGVREDDWQITRWRGSMGYNGFEKVGIQFFARDTRRDGWMINSFLGLGVPYVRGQDIDDRMSEYGVAVSIKNLPFKLTVEQSITEYERSRQSTVENGGSSVLTDDQILRDVSTPGSDSYDTPTTRLLASYGHPRFEVAAQALFRDDDFKTEREDSSLFELPVGNITFLSDVEGSSNRETTLANLRLAFAATDQLVVMINGDYHDRTLDASLSGQEIILIQGPETGSELTGDAANNGFFGQEDRDLELGVTWNRDRFKLSLTYRDMTRDVTWHRHNEADRVDVDRTSDGFKIMASKGFGKKGRAELGWEQDSFARYVFRTEPETVDRYWGKLKFKPHTKLDVNVYANFEAADNPDSIAALDRELTNFGVTSTFTNGDVLAVIGLHLFDFNSLIDTVFYGPDVQNDVSNYDSEFLNMSLHITYPFTDRVKLNLGGSFSEDRGESVPMTFWNGSVKLRFEGPWKTHYNLFGQHWSYEPDLMLDQAYDVTRYGVTVGRRF